MSHTLMGHANESCHIIWTSHERVTTLYTYEWMCLMHVTWWMRNDFIYKNLYTSMPWRIDACNRTRSYLWHDSLKYVTWHIHIYDMTYQCMWHDSLYIRHYALMLVTGLIRIYNLWQDSFLFTTCDRTHSYLQLSVTISFVFTTLSNYLIRIYNSP